VTWFLPQEDQYTTSKSKFLDEICGLLGGRAAEEVLFNEITTGASNDIERASHIARGMAMKYGMGDGKLGLVAYGERQGSMFQGVDPAMARNYSEDMAQHIDAFVRETIETQYERAVGIIKKYKPQIEELARILLRQETMSVEEFVEIFDGKKPAEVAEKKEEKKKKVEGE
jgi:cell division protease FtsH